MVEWLIMLWVNIFSITHIRISLPLTSHFSLFTAIIVIMEDFLEDLKNRPQHLCKKCGKCCKIINCKHLSEDNLCLIYENRPEVCGSFPYSPWKEIPDGCGFEGWIFQKREEKKQQIRKQKELLLSLEVSLKQADLMQTEKINESMEKIKNLINLYAKYGSWEW